MKMHLFQQFNSWVLKREGKLIIDGTDVLVLRLHLTDGTDVLVRSYAIFVTCSSWSILTLHTATRLFIDASK